MTKKEATRATGGRRFVVLSGPSGIGKGALKRALDRLHPGLISAHPILYTSRKRRVGECDGVDYHFKTEDDILALRTDPRYVVAQVRSDIQAIDLAEVDKLLEAHPLVFAEVFYTFGQDLKKKAAARGFEFQSVFLSPLPPGIPPTDIVAVMMAKLNRRATDDPDKIRERALSAPAEIEAANDYTHRLINTAGEDDVAQWGEFGVCSGCKGSRRVSTSLDLGERARWLVDTFVSIVNGTIPPMKAGAWLPESAGSLAIV